MSEYGRLSRHRSMIFDKVRNQAYRNALAQVLTPDSVVLDLGAGTGVLGLEAARLGARKVYLLERTNLVTFAAEVASSMGLSDKIEIIHEPIEQAKLPEKVDVILSVFTGNFLLEEDLLPLLFLARDRFLSPGGHMLPDRARMQLAAVSAADYYAEHIGIWETGGDLDYSSGRNYAVNTPGNYSRERYSFHLLSAPVTLHDLDFKVAQQADCRAEVELPVVQAGICHGLMGWFDMRLGDNWLSTSPEAGATHWRQMFFPLETPYSLAPGDKPRAGIYRPQYGDWSWTWKHGEAIKKYSAFKSTPLDISRLKKSAPGFRPRVNERGRLAQFALAQMNGERTLAEIADDLWGQFPQQFANREDAGHFLSRLARTLCQ